MYKGETSTKYLLKDALYKTPSNFQVKTDAPEPLLELLAILKNTTSKFQFFMNINQCNGDFVAKRSQRVCLNCVLKLDVGPSMVEF